MADVMTFPDDWHDFLQSYSFDDSGEFYTNGSRLIPVFCVEQLIEHLLKSQKPRLMTLEEIQHTDAVWLETHGWVDGDVFETVLRRRSDFEDYVTEFATNDDCDITCDNSKIGIEWRCWTSKPSDEVRRATPWN